jgi:hypothetical protein
MDVFHPMLIEVIDVLVIGESLMKLRRHRNNGNERRTLQGDHSQ